MRRTILGFGNPLLDISVSIKGNQLYQKYGLNPDGQKEISTKEMQDLVKDIEGYEQHISPGGCVLNSFRVFQWLCQDKCDVYFYGSVGQDPEAKHLTDMVQEQGVKTKLSIHENLPTGKAVALVNGNKRSLVAHLGAATVYSLDTIQQESFNTLFNDCDLVYLESFFLPNREGVGKYLVDLCEEGNKMLAFNLCGEYVFQQAPKTIKYLVKYADIVFGNKQEFEVLRILMKQHSFEEMAAAIINETRVTKSKHKKLLLRTDGHQEIVCVTEEGPVVRVKPQKIPKNEIKDTVGAGDAFVGGFLAGFCFNKKIEECFQLGMYCSKAIIKQTGCTIPNYKPEMNI